MRRKGLSDAVIEAKLAASKPKRDRKKAAAKKATAKPQPKAEKGKLAEKQPAPKGPSAAARANKLQNVLEQAELAKAYQRIQAQMRDANGLVDAGQVFKAQQARAAKERDALLALPSRIAGPMAARLGCSEPKLREELSRAMRTFLTERTQPDANTTAA